MTGRSDQPNILGRVARDTVSTSTDDDINRFMKKFHDLKENFDRGINVQVLIGVQQLSSMLSTSGQTGPNSGFSFPDGVKF
jgi:hypothetical protein